MADQSKASKDRKPPTRDDMRAAIFEAAMGGEKKSSHVTRHQDMFGNESTTTSIGKRWAAPNIQKLEELAIDAIYHGKADWM